MDTQKVLLVELVSSHQKLISKVDELCLAIEKLILRLEASVDRKEDRET